MLAQQLVTLDGPSGLRLSDIPEPQLGAGQVLVDLDAAGVAYPDLLQSTGSYQVTRSLPCVLGVEGAGVVRQAGPDTEMSAGDRVAVLNFDGTWQSTVAVPAEHVFALPETVTTSAAAGFLMNYSTCWFALQNRARALPGETVLVHGAGGGLGIAGLQVAKALGLRSIAVASDPRKSTAAIDNGADHVVQVDGFKSQVLELTDGDGVDIVLDPVGGDRFTDSVRALRSGGRLVVLGFVGGEIPTVRVNRLLLTNTAVVGAGWGEFVRTRPDYLKQQWSDMRTALVDGSLRVSEPQLFALADAQEALRSIQSRASVGKLALALR